MQKVRAPSLWLRGSAAVLMALLVVAIALPNAGRVVIDHSAPQGGHIEGRVRDSIVIIGITLLPLACILFIGRRWWVVEAVGWTLLLLLFVGAILH
jgi:hypothetical protein